MQDSSQIPEGTPLELSIKIPCGLEAQVHGEGAGDIIPLHTRVNPNALEKNLAQNWNEGLILKPYGDPYCPAHIPIPKDNAHRVLE